MSVRMVIRRSLAGAGLGIVAAATLGVVSPHLAAASVSSGTVAGRADAVDGNSRATVTLTCPEGMTAVGVSGEIVGFTGATITQLMPNGRVGVAKAVATQTTTSPWSLRAQMLCLPAMPGLEYVSKTFTRAEPLGFGDAVTCSTGKELIGLGWSVEPGARPELVYPMTTWMPSGELSPVVNGVVMNTAVPGDPNYTASRTYSATAVCADPGYQTDIVGPGVSTSRGTTTLSGSCPAGTRATALGFTQLANEGGQGHLLLRLTVESDGTTSTLIGTQLDSKSTRGDDTGIDALCVRS